MSRKPILTAVALVIIAFASISLFITLSQQPAGPPTLATSAPTFPTIGPATPDVRPTVPPLPPPPFTPPGTPLPTPDLGPLLTPQPTIPSPIDVVPLPPTVTSWVAFPGTKTGISFSYPAGWSVTENSFLDSAYSARPQITIYVTNYDFARAATRRVLPTGVLKIDILSFEWAIPSLGDSFSVGPEQYSGRRLVLDRSLGAELWPSLERSIAIYFVAGNRNWVIFAGFGGPQTTAVQNTDIFYQIVGSLRYANK